MVYNEQLLNVLAIKCCIKIDNMFFLLIEIKSNDWNWSLWTRLYTQVCCGTHKCVVDVVMS